MNLQDHALKASADQACDLLKALGNPHRLMIVCSLLELQIVNIAAAHLI